MPDFDKLHEEVKRLDSLLEDRQTGVANWYIVVGESWRKIAEIWNAPEERKDKNV